MIKFDDFQDLVDKGFHPVFSIHDGSRLLETGCAYKVWFRDMIVRSDAVVKWAVLDSTEKKSIKSDDILTFLYMTEEKVEDNFGTYVKYRVHFLFDGAIISFGTTNRKLDNDSTRSYMVWFKKII